MTGREMQEKVERATKALFKPGTKLMSSDVFSELNDAQDIVIREIYKKRFQESQEKKDFLRTLEVLDKEITPLVSGTDYKEGDLPSDYLFLTGDSTQLTYCSIVMRKPNRLTKTEPLREVLDFAFSKTVYESPVSVIHGSKIRVYFSDFTINKIFIDYLKKPATISSTVNSTLPESSHQDIVNIAISRIIERERPQRLQSKIVTDNEVKRVD